MHSIEHIKASLTEDNIVQLNVTLNVAELNKSSFLGSYKNIQMALVEALLNQAKQGDEQGARNTLEEINKLWFWQLMGVTQGNIKIEKGVLHGLSKDVEIDESFQRVIDGVKKFMELNGGKTE